MKLNLFGKTTIATVVTPYASHMGGIQQLRGSNFTQFWPHTPLLLIFLKQMFLKESFPKQMFPKEFYPILIEMGSDFNFTVASWFLGNVLLKPISTHSAPPTPLVWKKRTYIILSTLCHMPPPPLFVQVVIECHILGQDWVGKRYQSFLSC